MFDPTLTSRAYPPTGAYALPPTLPREALAGVRTRRILALCIDLIIVGILAIWEAVAASGLLFRDVVPSLLVIGGAIVELLADLTYYWNLGVTAGEIGLAMLIGGLAGLPVGILLGSNRLLSRAFESWFVPFLGFFLLPWTTLAYAAMWSSSNGVKGFEWFIVVLAF